MNHPHCRVFIQCFVERGLACRLGHHLGQLRVHVIVDGLTTKSISDEIKVNNDVTRLHPLLDEGGLASRRRTNDHMQHATALQA